ncbi:xanthine dehydrogenase small subunit [Parvibaculum sp.]|uniref:xanthine dehydrogenase small subunit n=1 Tax=Parvibaculum sp. TaxID=2024848 RepID=UPI00320CA1A7
MTMTVRFLLNGKPRIVRDVEATRTVLQHLRVHERALGTKEGCAEGDCGACTVAVGRPNGEGGFDFRAVNSCILLTAELDGCAVTTVEGLADAGDNAHPAQAKLVEHHGSQCGYCTPGIAMSLFAHEREGRSGATDDIHLTLSGNLCRCTGYRPIVDAAKDMVACGRSAEFDARERKWRGELDALIEEEAGDKALIDIAGFEAPADLRELDRLLAKHPDARILAGGTDLGVAVAKRAENPGPLISLSRLDALKMIEEGEDGVVIGAAVTYEEALPTLDRHFPAFAGIVRRIGSRQVRNLGTIGGNICNASPIGDSAPCLLALNAEVVLRSVEGRRKIPLDSFFVAYRKTALKPGEYLEAIHVPFLGEGDVFRAYKLSKRYDQDISTVSAAFRLTINGGQIVAARAAFGGMAATPARAGGLEKALVGATPERSTEAAGRLDDDFRPLSDFRGSAAYRLAAARGLVERLMLDVAGEETPREVWAL